jgi:hypothetical protein
MSPVQVRPENEVVRGAVETQTTRDSSRLQARLKELRPLRDLMHGRFELTNLNTQERIATSHHAAQDWRYF